MPGLEMLTRHHQAHIELCSIWPSTPRAPRTFSVRACSPKSVRLINVFLDVLQVFTQHKFICFCLDDLQFADDESLDVVTQIISRRTNIVIYTDISTR